VFVSAVGLSDHEEGGVAEVEQNVVNSLIVIAEGGCLEEMHAHRGVLVDSVAIRSLAVAHTVLKAAEIESSFVLEISIGEEYHRPEVEMNQVLGVDRLYDQHHLEGQQVDGLRVELAGFLGKFLERRPVVFENSAITHLLGDVGLAFPYDLGKA
jgi:hypothetical protein